MKPAALGALILSLGLTSPAVAQSDPDIMVNVSGFRILANGPEAAAGVSLRALASSVGRTTSGVVSMIGCAVFTASAGEDSEKNATAAWRVEITPLRVVDHAMTFRLRWIRSEDTSKNFVPRSEDVELTLRPGESRPMDSAAVASGAGPGLDGRPCDIEAGTLRVTVDYPDVDRRLIAADLWLVQRLPNGTESSQLQSVRGLPSRQIPFFFDRNRELNVDVSGHITLGPPEGQTDLELLVIQAKPSDTGGQGYQAQIFSRREIRGVKPGEVIEVPLAGPNGRDDRTFTLRIRVSSIR